MNQNLNKPKSQTKIVNQNRKPKSQSKSANQRLPTTTVTRWLQTKGSGYNQTVGYSPRPVTGLVTGLVTCLGYRPVTGWPIWLQAPTGSGRLRQAPTGSDRLRQAPAGSSRLIPIQTCPFTLLTHLLVPPCLHFHLIHLVLIHN